MKTPLAALALLLVLPLAACSGGEEEQSDPAPSSSPSESASPGEDLPVPTEQICAGLDVAALGEALGAPDLAVEVDAVAGETGAAGFPVVAPQCTLRSGGVTLDLSIGAVDADRDLAADVTESLDAAEEQGFQTCEEIRPVDSFGDREAVGYDCDVAAVEVEASSLAVRMAPTWLLSCALSAPQLRPAQVQEGLPAACGSVVDALAS